VQAKRKRARTPTPGHYLGVRSIRSSREPGQFGPHLYSTLLLKHRKQCQGIEKFTLKLILCDLWVIGVTFDFSSPYTLHCSYSDE
jgi:hypothetical protein